MIVAIIMLGTYYYADTQGLTVGQLFNLSNPVVRIGGIAIDVEVADTRTERIQGLSGRGSIEPIQGLLFIFDESDYHGVWMKDMNFPIDLIWINEDFEVIAITEGVLPESYPNIYEPPTPVLYLIETARYFSESFGIRVGDTVKIPKKFLE